MGIEKHARMTEDAEAKPLEEAVQTSYCKGGESASISSEVVSKETVMNKIHTLTFPCVELNIPDVITPAVRSLETVNNQFASALVRIADLTFIIKPALHRLHGKGLTINPKSAKR